MKTLIIAVFLFPAFANAKALDLTKMKEYKAKNPNSPVTEMNCKACHPKGKELNEFGKKYKDAGRKFENIK